jgi:ABC-type uncharacterized transport system substrate-binding protein
MQRPRGPISDVARSPASSAGIGCRLGWRIIAGLGSAAAWPVVARAQQAVPLIGLLSPQFPFLQAIEYRWEGQSDRLPAVAADLVRRPVTVIVATSVLAALATKAATTTIPIVFVTGFDPIASGLVASLSRPGRNLTGIANLTVELGPKRLQLLRELIPNAAVFGVLVEPRFHTGRILKGEKLVDLPVQQITKIELLINLKTTKALGLTIPETLLATADEVIQ